MGSGSKLSDIVIASLRKAEIELLKMDPFSLLLETSRWIIWPSSSVMDDMFERVKLLQADWDGYGAEAPHEQSIRDAWQFWNGLRAISVELPDPDVYATSEGGVCLEWKTTNVTLVVEFEPDEDADLFARTTEFDVQGPLHEHSQELFHALSAL